LFLILGDWILTFTWYKFGFPSSYWSDVLESTAVFVDLGYGSDPRLTHAIQFILGKQNARGSWKLENTLNSKMWIDIEQKGKPSKWVTLQSLGALKQSSVL
jgi:hypothetical protein